MSIMLSSYALGSDDAAYLLLRLIERVDHVFYGLQIEIIADKILLGTTFHFRTPSNEWTDECALICRQ